MTRPKGSKNKNMACISSKIVFPVRFESDLVDYIYTKPNKTAYINMLVRRDFEEHLKDLNKEG